MDDKSRECVAVAPDAGQLFYALTDWARVKLDGAATGGKLSVVEQWTLPGARPPLHRHSFDELHYVLQGEYEYYEEGKPALRFGPGGIFLAPSGAIHTYKNVGASTAQVLAIFAPAGFEHFYAELAMPVSSLSLPPRRRLVDLPATVALLLNQYGTEVLEPIAGLRHDGDGGP